jgi:outer membrane protein
MTKRILLALVCFLPLSLFAQDIKIGFYNKAEIFQSMPETIEATKKIDQVVQAYEKELSLINEEYQKKGSDYMAGRDTMPEAIRLRREAEVTDLQQRLQSFYQDSQDNIKKQQQDLITPIYKKLDAAIKSIGQENGYLLIFDTSVTASLSYWSVDKCTDVTNLIRAKLGLK